MRQLVTPYSTHPHNTFTPANEQTPSSTKPAVPQNETNTAAKGTGVTNIFDYYQQRPYASSWMHGSEIFYS
jgi:hypothetical protein